MISMLRWTLWDCFLAAIPVVLAFGLVRSLRFAQSSRHPRNWSIVAALGLLWLLFLPNSCYLLTEWRHFLFEEHFQAARDVTNPVEFSVYRVFRHVSFFAAFSGFGMVCFVLSIRPIGRWLHAQGISTLAVGIPFFLLIGLGVYLGLMIRLNSWDLFTRPTAVLGNTRNLIFRPGTLAVVSAFGLGLGLFYVALDIWIDGLAYRLGMPQLARTNPQSLGALPAPYWETRP